MRDTIFISHATPEDNDFVIWLASRLKLLGYNIWVDKNALLGGEKFWEEIDQIIRNKAIKVLLVYSNNICMKDENGFPQPGRLKDGIYKEYSLSESIGKQNRLDEFIILMNIDASTYNLFIGAERLNQIPFYDNWADGFKQLEKKLVKDQIPKNKDLTDESFSNWYTNQYLVPNGITARKELYYSNWWSIEKLPEYFYIFEFRTEKQAKAIYLSNNNFPLGKMSNYISSFEVNPDFKIKVDERTINVKHEDVHRIKISEMLRGFNAASFPNQTDAENHFKNLLQRVFHLIAKRRGLCWVDMSNKKMAYFHTPKSLEKLKIRFEYPHRTINKSKTKNLLGKYKNLGKWHFAISVKPILSPVVGFSLKSHITFTHDGFSVWKKEVINERDKKKHKAIDIEKIHTHRRAKGKTFFNEEWRDMLIGFLHSLKDNNKIQIRLSSSFNLQMPDFPKSYWASFGYFDPKDKSRHGLLSMYDARYVDEDEDEKEVDLEDPELDETMKGETT
ncbi:MAG TPA: toll/interleukin-1 receptor domain-containing protein [Chryseosolibacter sp.]